MKRFLAIIFATACFSVPFSSAHAAGGDASGSTFNSIYCFFFSCDTEQDREALAEAWGEYSEATSSVPELDAAGAPIAAALIAGLLGLGIERRRRKKIAVK